MAFEGIDVGPKSIPNPKAGFPGFEFLTQRNHVPYGTEYSSVA